MTNRPSGFIWYELMTSDVAAAAEFYGTVVGWTACDSGTPGMDYRLWSIDGVEVGGLMAIPAPASVSAMRPTWLGYLDVADVDASVADVVVAGGAVHMPPTDIPGVGRIAMVADPQGAAFYVMTPIGAGPSPAFAPGKPGHGGWHELHTSDWAAALAFYGAQFGWAKSEALEMGPMGTYLLFNTGGDAIGGMMNSPGISRPSWLYYFNVDDIDAAKVRVDSVGGTILNGPLQVPGGSWILQAHDRQGAMFALVGPRKP
jgi:predicted enzyme related to lactoylglutathione lyase